MRPLCVLFMILASPAIATAQDDLGRLGFTPFKAGDVIEVERRRSEKALRRSYPDGRKVEESLTATVNAALRAQVLEAREGLPSAVVLTLKAYERKVRAEDGTETIGGREDALVGKTFYGCLDEAGGVQAFDANGLPFRGPTSSELRAYLREVLGAGPRQGLGVFDGRSLSRGKASPVPEKSLRSLFRDGDELSELRLSLTPERIEAGDGLPRAVLGFDLAVVDPRQAPIVGRFQAKGSVWVSPNSGRLLSRVTAAENSYGGTFLDSERGANKIGGEGTVEVRETFRYNRADVGSEAKAAMKLIAAYRARPHLSLKARPLKVEDSAVLKTRMGLKSQMIQTGQPTVEVTGVIRSEVELTVLERELGGIKRSRLDLTLLEQERTTQGRGTSKRSLPLQGSSITVALDEVLSVEREGLSLPGGRNLLNAFNLGAVGSLAPRPAVFLTRGPIALGEKLSPPAAFVESFFGFGDFEDDSVGTLTLLRKEERDGIPCAVFKAELKGAPTDAPDGSTLTLTGSLWIGLNDALVRRAELKGKLAAPEPTRTIKGDLEVEVERTYTRGDQ